MSWRGTAVLPTIVWAADTTRIGSTASSASNDGGHVGPVNSPPVRSQSDSTLRHAEVGIVGRVDRQVGEVVEEAEVAGARRVRARLVVEHEEVAPRLLRAVVEDVDRALAGVVDGVHVHAATGRHEAVEERRRDVEHVEQRLHPLDVRLGRPVEAGVTRGAPVDEQAEAQEGVDVLEVDVDPAGGVGDERGPGAVAAAVGARADVARPDEPPPDRAGALAPVELLEADDAVARMADVAVGIVDRDARAVHVPSCACVESPAIWPRRTASVPRSSDQPAPAGVVGLR